MHAVGAEQAQVIRVTHASGCIDLFVGQYIDQVTDAFQVRPRVAAYPFQGHDDQPSRQQIRPLQQVCITQKACAGVIQ